MEAISAVSAIFHLAQLSAQVLKRINEFDSSSAAVPQSLGQLANKLCPLKGISERIHGKLSEQST